MASSNLTMTAYENGGSGRANSSEYTYDPKTGKWIPPTPVVGTSPSSKNPENAKPVHTGSSSNPSPSKEKADKEYIETEFNTLVGDLVVSPSKKTIRIGVNDTVEVLGVGSHLSGKYFVSAVKRTLNRDSGYSQTLTVIKNGFGDSLKKPNSGIQTTENRSETVEKSAPTLKLGDTVRIVGDAVYSNAHEGTTVPAWVKEKTLTIKQISSDGSRVLLMPINSWTYVRYVQKL